MYNEMVNRATTLAKIPKSNYMGKSSHLRGKVTGKGIGNVLLDNGLGGSSSYADKNNFLDTTNWTLKGRESATSAGMGLSSKIGKKLADLNIQKPVGQRKKANISFSL
tara:strand:- start:400 stop:723 length:324 start_codon:yes stop_codon:yes gene_type:complete